MAGSMVENGALTPSASWGFFLSLLFVFWGEDDTHFFGNWKGETDEKSVGG